MTSYALKIVLLGDCGVGKTQLSRRQTKNNFFPNSTTTVGVEFATSSIEFEKCTIKAQIWDTAGQHRMESMLNKFFNKCVAAALVYDVTSRSSFESVQSHWLPRLREWMEKQDTSVHIVLVGNKIDLDSSASSSSSRPSYVQDSLSSESDAAHAPTLCDNNPPPLIDTSQPAQPSQHRERVVSVEEGIALAEKERFDFVEVSAQSGYQVNTLFRRLALSAASRLPDVKSHLELTQLPVGWLSVLPKDAQERERTGIYFCSTCRCLMRPAKNGKDDKNTQNEVLSEGSSGGSLKTDKESNITQNEVKLCPHCGNDLCGSQPPTPHSVCSQSTHTTLATQGLSESVGASVCSMSIESDWDRPSMRRSVSQASSYNYSYADVIVKRGGRQRSESQSLAMPSHNPLYLHKLRAPPMQVLYVNYWTGEEVDEEPTQRAHTGMLYAAPSLDSPAKSLNTPTQWRERDSSASTVRESCESVLYETPSPRRGKEAERARSRSFTADDDNEDALSLTLNLSKEKERLTPAKEKRGGVKEARCARCCVIS